MNPHEIVTILGARPQFIKAAPVSRAFQKAGLAERILHTGQHFDVAMSGTFFDELGIPAPAHHLNINNLPHGAMTGRMMEGIEAVLLERPAALVVVYGDTNSTLAGALAATKLHIPVAHIEAGLRSFNRAMPEEINRVLVDHMAKLHYCPTEAAVSNLRNENVTQQVMHVGDVMMDATLHTTQLAAKQSTILKQHFLTPKAYSVCTLHRAENTDDPAQLREVVAWLETKATEMPMVLPLHPRTQKAMAAAGIVPQHIRIIEPLGYVDMVQLLHHAVMIYTDSGGVQKEAYFHHVPCVTLREETEWVETIDAGWNRLWRDPDYAPRQEITDYGTGDASSKIAAHIAEFLKNVAA